MNKNMVNFNETLREGCIDAANFWPSSVSEYIEDGTRKSSEQLIEVIKKMTPDEIEELFQELVDNDVLTVIED